jgi:hypothetical protein
MRSGHASGSLASWLDTYSSNATAPTSEMVSKFTAPATPRRARHPRGRRCRYGRSNGGRRLQPSSQGCRVARRKSWIGAAALERGPQFRPRRGCPSTPDRRCGAVRSPPGLDRGLAWKPQPIQAAGRCRPEGSATSGHGSSLGEERTAGRREHWTF